MFLMVDLFRRHAEAYANCPEKHSETGCAAIIVGDYVPRWGCPHTYLSDRRPEFTSAVCRAVYEMVRSVKRFTGSYHPQTNGMVERLDHTLCPILSHMAVDDQSNWDESLMHAISAHNDNDSRGTGLSPHEVRIG